MKHFLRTAIFAVIIFFVFSVASLAYISMIVTFFNIGNIFLAAYSYCKKYNNDYVDQIVEMRLKAHWDNPTFEQYSSLYTQLADKFNASYCTFYYDKYTGDSKISVITKYGAQHVLLYYGMVRYGFVSYSINEPKDIKKLIRDIKDARQETGRP